MRLCDLCSTPCFPAAVHFIVPSPNAPRARFKFASEGNRDFYAVLLNNHPPESRGTLNPELAIVGLSPAGNQIAKFLKDYSESGDYGAASVEAAFAGLDDCIISMLNGLGLTKRLGLSFGAAKLKRHPAVYVTSLVACATLDADGGSDAFDPAQYRGARKCATERFVPEILSANFNRLRTILVLGTDGWKAANELKLSSGRTIVQALRSAGKIVMPLPHPSGQNGEYVKLASLRDSEFPSRTNYVASCWSEYKDKPPRKGRAKQSERGYKSRRESAWAFVYDLRQQVSRL